jgi:N-methylhydantoinase A
MRREAEAAVALGSFGAPMVETRIAYMRYVGQGHEIAVVLPEAELRAEDVALIRARYDEEYTRQFDRPVPGSDIEVMSYAVLVSTAAEPVAPVRGDGGMQRREATPTRTQTVRDTVTGAVSDWAVHDRAALGASAAVSGPAVIAEDETSTLVGPGWTAVVNGLGYIELSR